MFPPRAGTDPRQCAAGAACPTVYSSPPAPIGLADLGFGANGSYQYATSSFEGRANLTSAAAFSPGYGAWEEAPDWIALQLDTVAVNVSYGGGDEGTFWLQNVARWNSSELVLEDNIWNLSSSGASVDDGAFVSGSGEFASSAATGGLGFYYDLGPGFPITFPLNLTLTTSVGAVAGLPVAWFNYSLDDEGGSSNSTFDTVVWAGAADPAAPFELSVNGSGTNPAGLRDDAEFVFGGDGDGANANVAALDGTLSLERWNRTMARFEPIPSGYDYGVDAAETVQGVAAYYLGTTEHLDAGPSFLYGLWNTSLSSFGPAAAPGWIDYRISPPVPDAFIFARNGTAAGFNSSSFVPANASGVATGALPPPLQGLPYSFGVWSNGFAPNESISVDSNATGTVRPTLASASGSFSAPVYLTGSAIAPALGAANLSGVTWDGAGKDLWINNTSSTLAPPFLQVNDFAYPTFELFADDGVPGLHVHLDNFVQAPSSFVYQQYGVARGDTGWTQAYDFVGAAAGSTVANLSLTGLSTFRHSSAEPGGSVDFNLSIPRWASLVVFDSAGFSVANLSTNGTGVGAWVVDSEEVNVTGLAAALVVNGPLPSSVSEVSPGLYLGALTGVAVVGSSNVSVADMTAQFGSFGCPAGSSVCGVIGVSGVADRGLTLGSVSVSSSAEFLFDPPSTNLCPETAPALGLATPSNPTAIDDLVAVGACLNGSVDVSGSDGESSGPYSLGLDAVGGSVYHVSSWNSEGGGQTGAVVDAVNISIDRSASINASGWNLSFDRRVTVQDLTTYGWAEDGPQRLESDAIDRAEHSADLSVENLTAWNAAVGAQTVEYSANLSFQNVGAENLSFGLLGFLTTENVSISNVTARDGSYGAGLSFCIGCSLVEGAAVNDSIVELVDGGELLSVKDVSATDGSMAVDLNEADGSNVQNVTASNGSVGVDWATGANDSVSNVWGLNSSTAVDFTGLVGARVTDVNASASVLGSLYFVNPVFDLPFAIGAVQLYVVANVTVDEVSATSAAFAVWALDSSNLTIDDVRSTNAWVGVQLNYTDGAAVSRLFAFGDEFGVNLQFSSNVTCEASTIEDSTSYGVLVVSGMNTTFFGNNFVGNNGASENGTYDPARPQAVAGAGADGNFSWEGMGNYWSDWSGGGAYPVGPHIADLAPVPSFIRSWLQFHAEGLVAGLDWSVTLGGVEYATDEPGVWLPAWTLPQTALDFQVSPPPGWGATPTRGAVVFNGSNATVVVTFHRPYFSVAFNATGLPNGSRWTVTVAGETESNDTIRGAASDSFTLPNGTFAYRIIGVAGYEERAVPYMGTVQVDGAGVSVEASFTPSTYGIVFTESGLGAGLSWTVVLNGSSERSTGGPLEFPEPNGTYPYEISGIPGWHETSLPYRGNVTLAGSNRTEAVDWYAVAYAVVFVGAGLPAGVDFGVRIHGEELGSSDGSAETSLANGTYPFQVVLTVATGYAPTPEFGNLTVNGSSCTVNITFVLGGGGSAAPFPWLWLGLGVTGSAVVLLAVACTVRRRPKLPQELGGPTLDPMSRPRSGDLHRPERQE